MSAAFDAVNTELLLEKMRLYGFDKDAVQSMWSYLTYRSQCVYIEGSMSELLPLGGGVPQCSILGPQSSLMRYLRLYIWLTVH